MVGVTIGVRAGPGLRQMGLTTLVRERHVAMACKATERQRQPPDVSHVARHSIQHPAIVMGSTVAEFAPFTS